MVKLIIESTGLGRVMYDESDLIENPLWFHKKCLMQTATGYGRKLVTTKMIKINKRLHRVYCNQFSNTGSCYVIVKGKNYYL